MAEEFRIQLDQRREVKKKEILKRYDTLNQKIFYKEQVRLSKEDQSHRQEKVKRKHIEERSEEELLKLHREKERKRLILEAAARQKQKEFKAKIKEMMKEQEK